MLKAFHARPHVGVSDCWPVEFKATPTDNYTRLECDLLNFAANVFGERNNLRNDLPALIVPTIVAIGVNGLAVQSLGLFAGRLAGSVASKGGLIPVGERCYRLDLDRQSAISAVAHLILEANTPRRSHWGGRGFKRRNCHHLELWDGPGIRFENQNPHTRP